MSDNKPSEMEQYAARKNMQNRGGAYLVLILVAAIAGFVLYVALDTGNTGTFLVLGIPALVVMVICLYAMYAVNKQAKK